jgi:hypothetical protein
MVNAWGLVGILALLLSGCDGREDSETPARSAAASGFETSVTKALEAAKSLVLHDVQYIPDGGSVDFLIRTDSGFEMNLQALHHRPDYGGNADHQEFRIYERGAKFVLARNSSLESRLIQLLGSAQVTPDPESSWKPTPQTLEWILARLKDRSLPYSTVPLGK